MKTDKSDPITSESGKTLLPVHSLQKNEPLISVKEIQYKNPYDFTRKHRHTYFEFFFFETGGGNQLIDFIEYPVVENSCYIVCPGQVHLLNRNPKAVGYLIQFNEEVIVSQQLKISLRNLLFGNNGAIIFENDPERFNSSFQALGLLKETTEKKSADSGEIALYFLQALLLQLVDSTNLKRKEIDNNKKLLYRFQLLLEEQLFTNHSVNKYASLLHITEKKLSNLTKKHMGISPLQVIHNRLVLETKRILLFETISHKEIAYRLGFDSAASFSQFIKNKTGYSPSDLYTHLVEIHK